MSEPEFDPYTIYDNSNAVDDPENAEDRFVFIMGDGERGRISHGLNIDVYAEYQMQTSDNDSALSFYFSPEKVDEMITVLQYWKECYVRSKE